MLESGGRRALQQTLQFNGGRIPRAAFGDYLRTGVVAVAEPAADDVEVKFNPWHDPENGRFTFSGRGRYFAANAGGTWAGGGFTGGGGGGFGGAGATGYWYDPEPRYPEPRRSRPVHPPRRKPPEPRKPVPARPPVRLPPPVAKPTVAVPATRARPAERWQPVIANGYKFELDAGKRMRHLTGTVTRNPDQVRSRSSQARAGGPDRRPTDHGGHYIARRFNGPTEAFNHFAQDANFNKSAYAAMENQWERASRAGRKVLIDIVPHYVGLSQRPYEIVVMFTIDESSLSFVFPNEPQGRGGKW
jgi:hypothetical protein